MEGQCGSRFLGCPLNQPIIKLFRVMGGVFYCCLKGQSLNLPPHWLSMAQVAYPWLQSNISSYSVWLPFVVITETSSFCLVNLTGRIIIVADIALYQQPGQKDKIKKCLTQHHLWQDIIKFLLICLLILLLRSVVLVCNHTLQWVCVGLLGSCSRATEWSWQHHKT